MKTPAEPPVVADLAKHRAAQPQRDDIPEEGQIVPNVALPGAMWLAASADDGVKFKLLARVAIVAWRVPTGCYGPGVPVLMRGGLILEHMRHPDELQCAIEMPGIGIQGMNLRGRGLHRNVKDWLKAINTPMPNDRRDDKPWLDGRAPAKGTP